MTEDLKMVYSSAMEDESRLEQEFEAASAEAERVALDEAFADDIDMAERLRHIVKSAQRAEAAAREKLFSAKKLTRDTSTAYIKSLEGQVQKQEETIKSAFTTRSSGNSVNKNNLELSHLREENEHLQKENQRKDEILKCVVAIIDARLKG
ncbi:hypothetical protein BDZ97DRAFT_1918492 [Flammula alnicola]|nr:hypothetical protein BDZ97DRAFT_1918492 [Flammula alnicola]